ncbi:MAG: NAD(P)H-hydrate dehydratase, partial [Erysipelotrichaceae bacterium]|nr:NAD(P)H-hydrate dehydratase [Erysipelotrichaceae bacterium]
DITLALEKKKYFHDKSKEHGLFRECVVLPLGFDKDNVSDTYEMSEKEFLRHFPPRSVNAYKGSEGKCMLMGGSLGMAGAVGLNIIGAKSVGSSFIHVGLEEGIYPIVANRFLTPVYHLLDKSFKLLKVDSLGFGSGCTNMVDKTYWLHKVLESDIPCVIDAEGINLLQYDTEALKVDKPLIMTPHVMEFSRVSGLSVEEISKDRIGCATSFAKAYKCVVVLKGAHTIVAGPKGELYINQTGNQGLAQAGSGDVLTGMITGLLARVKEPFVSACMGVWFHGYLADMMSKDHSLVTLPLEEMVTYADQFFKKFSR